MKTWLVVMSIGPIRYVAVSLLSIAEVLIYFVGMPTMRHLKSESSIIRSVPVC